MVCVWIKNIKDKTYIDFQFQNIFIFCLFVVGHAIAAPEQKSKRDAEYYGLFELPELPIVPNYDTAVSGFAEGREFERDNGVPHDEYGVPHEEYGPPSVQRVETPVVTTEQ